MNLDANISTDFKKTMISIRACAGNNTSASACTTAEAIAVMDACAVTNPNIDTSAGIGAGARANTK